MLEGASVDITPQSGKPTAMTKDEREQGLGDLGWQRGGNPLLQVGPAAVPSQPAGVGWLMGLWLGAASSMTGAGKIALSRPGEDSYFIPRAGRQ